MSLNPDRPDASAATVVASPATTWVTDFLQGVKVLFNNWTALQLCMLENPRGRRLSPEARRQEIYSSVIAVFDPSTSKELRALRNNVNGLAEYLDILFWQQFRCELEDGSSQVVAEMIIKLHQTLSRGDKSFYSEVQGHGTGGTTESRGLLSTCPDTTGAFGNMSELIEAARTDLANSTVVAGVASVTHGDEAMDEGDEDSDDEYASDSDLEAALAEEEQGRR